MRTATLPSTELEELKGSVLQLKDELHRLQSIFRTYSVTINDLGGSQWKLASPVVVTIEQRSETDFAACLYDVDIYGYGDSIPECLDDLKLHIVSQLEFLSQEETRVELGIFPAKQLAILRNLIMKRINLC
ncbi:hypothetical protein KKG61_07105 [bacterium]|nr:hypothetical protein [bacterium]